MQSAQHDAGGADEPSSGKSKIDAAREGGWRVRASEGGVYTGGKAEVCARDPRFFACLLSENIAVVSCATGRVLFTLQPRVDGAAEEDAALVSGNERFTTFALEPSGGVLVSASSNQLLRRWRIGELVARKLAHEASASFELVPGLGSVLLKGAAPEYPEMERSWKGHEAPVMCADFHASGELVATGSSDRTVKVWSVQGGYCTHNFRLHKMGLTAVRFGAGAELRLCSADVLGAVFLWDLTEQTSDAAGRHKHVALKNHMSAVTSVCFAGPLVFSAGRDKVLSVWGRHGQLLLTFPVMEMVEGMQVLPGEAVLDGGAEAAGSAAGSHSYYLATAGERGVVRVWRFALAADGASGKMALLRAQPPPSSGAPEPFTGLLTLGSGAATQLVGLRFDCKIQFFDARTLERSQQIVGYSDEVTDLCYLPGGALVDGELPRRRVVMATNSEQVIIKDLEAGTSELLAGHTQVVLCVDVSKCGRYIATGSKDRTCRVWDAASRECVAVASGHTEPIAAVAFVQTANLEVLLGSARAAKRAKGGEEREDADGGGGGGGSSKLTLPLVATTSSDKTVKLWSKLRKGGAASDALVCKHTVLAHDKEINALAASPNKALLASGSADKTVRLWAAGDLADRGALRGHRRGVWHVQFSPTERCLASASSDKTVRVWSVADLSCLAVMEGHATSVLRVQYTHSGKSIISAAGNGVLKVWSVSQGDCVATLEHHTDKVWALAMPPPAAGATPQQEEELAKELLSGGADARLVLWRDCSRELADLEMARSEQEMLQEEEMISSLRKREFLRAALRAIELDRPFQLRTTLEAMLAAGLPNQDLPALVAALKPAQLLRLWELARDWNTHARNAALAQSMLEALIQADVVPLAQPAKARQVLDPLLAYGERHLQRIDRLVKDSFLFEHALACIDNGVVPIQHEA